jgi:hypothetical protein
LETNAGGKALPKRAWKIWLRKIGNRVMKIAPKKEPRTVPTPPRDSVPLYRYSVPPPICNMFFHKDFSGIFSRLPFFYLSSTTDGVVDNCGAYTCAGCVNNSPPEGGRKERPPRFAGGCAPPPVGRLPPFLSAKKVPLPTFIQQDDKRGVILLCLSGFFPSSRITHRPLFGMHYPLHITCFASKPSWP